MRDKQLVLIVAIVSVLVAPSVLVAQNGGEDGAFLAPVATLEPPAPEPSSAEIPASLGVPAEAPAPTEPAPADDTGTTETTATDEPREGSAGGV